MLKTESETLSEATSGRPNATLEQRESFNSRSAELNISLQSSGMRRKQNFGSKSETAVLTFTLRFLSSPLFSLFLPHFFFF